MLGDFSRVGWEGSGVVWCGMVCYILLWAYIDRYVVGRIRMESCLSYLVHLRCPRSLTFALGEFIAVRVLSACSEITFSYGKVGR